MKLSELKMLVSYTWEPCPSLHSACRRFFPPKEEITTHSLHRVHVDKTLLLLFTAIRLMTIFLIHFPRTFQVLYEESVVKEMVDGGGGGYILTWWSPGVLETTERTAYWPLVTSNFMCCRLLKSEGSSFINSFFVCEKTGFSQLTGSRDFPRRG